MNIKIVRYRKKPDTIDGQLWIDGKHICDTAENVNGALPTGKHPVSVIKCKQYARKMLLFNSSPPCDKCPTMEYCGINSTLPCFCPQLCPGNGVYNRKDGAILVGTYLAPGCLVHPRDAFSNIYDRIRKSTERGHNVTLTIEEHYPKQKHLELSTFEMGTQILAQMGGQKPTTFS